MVDFIERFFKLTLDNVYRFTCSLLAVVALFTINSAPNPIAGLTWLLDWSGIPSSWLVPVGDWIADRQEVVAAVAALVLLVALVAAARAPLSRAGSTALLSIVVLAQVGFGCWVLVAAVAVAIGLGLVSWLTVRAARRLYWSEPKWTGSVWGWITRVVGAVILAVIYLISPLGWLISQDFYHPRGSQQNPLHIEQGVPRTPTPTGALPLRRK